MGTGMRGTWLYNRDIGDARKGRQISRRGNAWPRIPKDLEHAQTFIPKTVSVNLDLLYKLSRGPARHGSTSICLSSPDSHGMRISWLH
jgi:hypothetical protein